MGNQQDLLGKTKIIAEIGVNHDGSISKALDLIKISHSCGVDFVKFQTFKAENVATKAAPKANYQLKVTSKNESQLKMLKKLELRKEHYPLLIQKCKDLGIGFLSTPYDIYDANFLVSMGVKTLKIASGQLIEYLFLKDVSKICDEIILSTGMANMNEVMKAVSVIRKANPKIDLYVLQCTTNYPSKIENANIRAMLTMKEKLKVKVGYSDHVPNNYAAYSAVALGAEIIEKHITYDKSAKGPDHSCSLNPNEFKNFVDGVRQVELCLGHGKKIPSQNEKENTIGMRRSLVYRKKMSIGETVDFDSIALKRPQSGLVSEDIPFFIGKKLRVEVSQDQLMKKEHV